MIVMLVLVVTWSEHLFLNDTSNIRYVLLRSFYYVYSLCLLIWCFLGITGSLDTKTGKEEPRDLGLSNPSLISLHNKMESNIFPYQIKIPVPDPDRLHKEVGLFQNHRMELLLFTVL